MEICHLVVIQHPNERILRQRRRHAEGASVIFLWEARKERGRKPRWEVARHVACYHSDESQVNLQIFLFLLFPHENSSLLLSLTKLCDPPPLSHFGKVELFCQITQRRSEICCLL